MGIQVTSRAYPLPKRRRTLYKQGLLQMRNRFAVAKKKASYSRGPSTENNVMGRLTERKGAVQGSFTCLRLEISTSELSMTDSRTLIDTMSGATHLAHPVWDVYFVFV